MRGRPSKSITAFGETKTISQWLTDPRCRVDRRCLHWRLAKGMLPEKAIELAPHKCGPKPTD
jgi:hypothetical protein